MRTAILYVAAIGVLAGGLATPASAQFACTTPNDPACNHLKCYQIRGAPITVNVQVDNQFDREAFIQLQPVLLCTPAEKSCCIAGAGCSPNNCPPNPVPAPGLPHFKCYKFKGKTACTDLACTSTVKFPKGTVVNLTDQFGVETNVPVGKPVIFCAPALKQVVSPTTTTTTLGCPPNCPTTTTTMRGCSQIAGSNPPMCDTVGCMPPLACVFVNTMCTCETPCGGTGGACSGFCPNAAQACKASTTGVCGCCVPTGGPCTPGSSTDCCSGTCNAAGMCP